MVFWVAGVMVELLAMAEWVASLEGVSLRDWLGVPQLILLEVLANKSTTTQKYKHKGFPIN